MGVVANMGGMPTALRGHEDLVACMATQSSGHGTQRCFGNAEINN